MLDHDSGRYFMGSTEGDGSLVNFKEMIFDDSKVHRYDCRVYDKDGNFLRVEKWRRTPMTPMKHRKT